MFRKRGLVKLCQDKSSNMLTPVMFRKRGLVKPWLDDTGNLPTLLNKMIVMACV
jgi:hypothetical protein